MTRRQPALVIVEGIMGSGKTTTAQFITANLNRGRAVTEATSPHPVRANDGLSHWYQPWLDISPAGYAERSLERWRAFVAATHGSDETLVLDGQLFHGDLTNLFLMKAGWDAIADYNHAVEDIIRPPSPLLVYFYQADVDAALRVIATERGPEWVRYQADWKLQAPYCRRRHLSGLEGLIALYQEYRALTDALFAKLDIAKLAIENSARAWATYHERILHRTRAVQ